MDNNTVEFSKRLRMMRHYFGYSQEELADMMHVTRQTISRWEKGMTTPTLKELNQLVQIFQMSLAEFVVNM
jgi:DNA-binding XRE family transcriptional regulator